MRKEKLEKIILGILTFILINYISISLIFLSMHTISKKFFNKDNLKDFINNIDIIEVLKDELGSDFNLNIIRDELINMGITDDGINCFVNSEDIKEFSSNTIYNIFDKVSGNTNIDYQINNDEFYNLFVDNIDKLQTNSNIDTEKLLNKIKSKVPNLTNIVNDLIVKVVEKIENSNVFVQYKNYVFKSIGILDILYSRVITFLISCVIVSFIMLLIFIRRSFYKTLKWLSISFIIPSLIFLITSTIIYSFIKIDNILVRNIFDIINVEIINCSIIYFIISLIFVIINIVMYMVKKYKNKKVSHE